jgi:tripartite-type tricarboxylate transporter receptor subunit TctC
MKKLPRSQGLRAGASSRSGIALGCNAGGDLQAGHGSGLEDESPHEAGSRNPVGHSFRRPELVTAMAEPPRRFPSPWRAEPMPGGYMSSAPSLNIENRDIVCKKFQHQLIEAHIMKLPRRQFIRLAAGAAALLPIPRIARAQTYPTRPVRIIVAAAAAGATDITARLIGQWLSERLGQPFLVENRPGANSDIGTEAVVRAPVDGYTLLLAISVNAINASLYERLSYNFIRDIAPIARIADTPLVMVVNPLFPAKTVPEFIAYAKANPGKLNAGSGGVGTPIHVAGELFKMTTGVNLVPVQYRGGAPALADLLAGQVQVMFGVMSESIEYVRAGRLRALAVLSATPCAARHSHQADFVPGLEASFWTGLCAPKNTPVEIINKLNIEINAALADPAMKARFADLGATMYPPGSPGDFSRFIADDTEKWAKVVKFAGIKAD